MKRSLTYPTLTTLPSANLARRLMAMLYDSFLLLGISFAYGVVLLLLRRLFGDDTMQAPDSSLQLLIMVGWWFFCALFFVWCWRRSGQTLGMKSWRIQLIGQNEDSPPWQACWKRTVFAPLSFAVFGIGYLWCLVDRNGDCLHDKWSHTRTVVLPKPPKRSKKNPAAN